ncbi:MAG: glycoside hydrolase family 3 C-terminal domain-containing protein [Olsenella sp.]|jgi:beta-glucosidase
MASHPESAPTGTSADARPAYDRSPEVERAVEAALAVMTLKEKCALLQGATSFGTRGYELADGRHVPTVEFSDGPHGLRHQAVGDHLGLNESSPATCFPTAVTLADTWDEALAEAEGRALGEEAASQGVGVLLGPGLCIKRSPLCGRSFEYLSEDPLLSGKLAAAYVRGVQSCGISACPKHLAANSQETRRLASDSIVDARTLREIYLRGFEVCVRESAPRCIMTSYNLVDGVYAGQSPVLLDSVLRGEWGFEGAVVSDWGATEDHVAAVRAGCDFEMPDPGLASARALERAVREGRLPQETLDRRVREALELVYSVTPAVAAAPAAYDAEAHHELARRIAAEGAVLLKNEPRQARPGAPVVGGGASFSPDGAAGHAAGADGAAGAPILPLAPHTRVALVGEYARKPRYQGLGSSHVNAAQVDDLVGLMGSSPDLDLVGFATGFRRGGGADEALVAEAVELARTADVVVVCMGLEEGREGEGRDRTDLLLSAGQVACLEAVAAANPNVVALLSSGGVVETGWASCCRALFYQGLGGQASAAAALDVLTGRCNPSGKLAESWPRRIEDTPTFGNYPSARRTAEYREGLYVGYRYYGTARVRVAYPFGFGLSYTTFDLSDLSVAPGLDSVRVRVHNAGVCAGAEVVQLYVSKPDRQVFGPEEELAGFRKVFLQPGETAEVVVPVDGRAFQYFNVKTDAWEVEGGSYELRVGTSCEDVRLRASVRVSGTGAPDPYVGLGLASYQYGLVKHVPDASFAALLGGSLPSARIPLDHNLCMRDLNHGRSPVFWAVWAVLTALERENRRSPNPSTDLDYVYNMPLRNISQMSDGRVSPFMVEGLVWEVRGLWGVGFAMFAAGFPVNAILNFAWERELAAPHAPAAPARGGVAASGLRSPLGRTSFSPAAAGA